LVEPSNSIERDYENIKAKNKNLLNSIDFYKKAIIKMNQDIIDYKENSVLFHFTLITGTRAWAWRNKELPTKRTKQINSKIYRNQSVNKESCWYR